MTQRIIFQCTTWARDYQVMPYQDRNHQPVLAYKNETGHVIRFTGAQDEGCPVARQIWRETKTFPEGHKIKASLVTATLNEAKPCDGRCTGAHGPVCNCSCAGANHGADYLSTP